MNKIIDARPWGKFEQFTLNEKTTIKIISVKPRSRLSLQYHNHREEFWRVLSGRGEVVINDATLPAGQGDEFFIPVKTNHRVQTKASEMVFLEISFGQFDESDIIRIEDDYNRN